MDSITPSLPFETFFGFTFIYEVVFWSTIVMLLVLVVGWLLGRNLRKRPGRRQSFAELLVGSFLSLSQDSIGKSRGRKYTPIFGTLFLYILFSNLIGLVPAQSIGFPKGEIEIGGDPYVDFNDNGKWDAGEPLADKNGFPIWNQPRKCGVVIPAPLEPTRNLNFSIGISLMLALAMYLVAIRIKGILGFIKTLFEPMPWMFPLNIVGQVAQVVSVSFRLFGNMFGGAVIMVIAGTLISNIVIPIVILGFLGVFAGTIQAFVFTMLWIAYHVDMVGETEGQES